MDWPWVFPCAQAKQPGPTFTSSVWPVNTHLPKGHICATWTSHSCQVVQDTSVARQGPSTADTREPSQPSGYLRGSHQSLPYNQSEPTSPQHERGQFPDLIQLQCLCLGHFKSCWMLSNWTPTSTHCTVSAMGEGATAAYWVGLDQVYIKQVYDYYLTMSLQLSHGVGRGFSCGNHLLAFFSVIQIVHPFRTVSGTSESVLTSQDCLSHFLVICTYHVCQYRLMVF